MKSDMKGLKLSFKQLSGELEDVGKLRSFPRGQDVLDLLALIKVQDVGAMSIDEYMVGEYHIQEFMMKAAQWAKLNGIRNRVSRHTYVYTRCEIWRKSYYAMFWSEEHCRKYMDWLTVASFHTS